MNNFNRKFRTIHDEGRTISIIARIVLIVTVILFTVLLVVTGIEVSKIYSKVEKEGLKNVLEQIWEGPKK